MPSPRMRPPHGGQPQPVPHAQPGTPVPVPQWGYYYYPGMPMDPNYNPYPPPQRMPQHMPQPHPPQGPPGAPIPGLPMSPRGQQPPLHAPGTPTLTPALPPNAHPPHSTPSPHTHTASLSMVKSESGQEVDLEPFKRQAPGPILSPIVTSSPARRPFQIRMETEEAKQKQLAEEAAEKEKKQAEVRAKQEAEEKAKSKAEEKAKREERVRREEEEKEQRREEEKERLREEQEWERKCKEEEAVRLRKEAEEKAKREEEERAACEAEETAKAKSEAEAEAAVAAAAAEATKTGLQREEAKDQVSDKVPLRIDTTLTSSDGKRRPGRLDLSGAKDQGIPAALPSALTTALIIEDIGSIQYPEGVKSPKPELNINAKQSKFRYNRNFLLQCMAVCKGKPDSLPPLDAIGPEPIDQRFALIPGGSHDRRSSSTAMPPPSRQASVGLGISGFNKPSVNPFTMGQFSTPTQKLSSEERFAASNRSTSMSGTQAGMPFGRPPPMVRSSSQGGPGHSSSGRTRSQLGGKRDKERNDDQQFLQNVLTKWYSKHDVEEFDRSSQIQEQAEESQEFVFADDEHAEDTLTYSTSSPLSIVHGCIMAPLRMSHKEASERIEKAAATLSGLHDVGAALDVFHELSPRYHSRLVDRLVSSAMESDTFLLSQVMAYFFRYAAQGRICSAQALKDGVSLTASNLLDIAVDVPDALSRYAIMIKAAGLHEASNWRMSILEKVGSRGPELASLLDA
ncbi:hypothetical protein DICSQDRAFT_174514 [Dichomitus squalens LYAD-421 SS1]|uniref:Eukaryotic translation initiation factor 4G1 eIF4E-binding domain-containing protein n=1 Tax=Dichomitus squalens (strain LYAD-421) TaxID=732165 RepID=R7SPC7_DICSQ|nr:uncharacterized protein DICSQDRAFT_174514 [Dichomitus squalens LYAD-421 SS1]EJF56832.1 hypothetical protein DICSQDRAFT_174514 [Dichomitus squalens LYAD-421 SS1]